MTVTSDSQQWLGRAERVLFVHAHPDDETIATGGTLAGLAAAGRDPLLVTLTRGEQGEVVPGPFAHLAGTTALAAHRETELAAALAMLGVTEHAYLGTPPARAAGLPPRVYEDSGMAWGDDGFATAADDAPETALTRAAAVDPLSDVLALAAEWGAEAIVSYDDRGGYGHPDHVFAHRAARAVARGLDLPFWEIVAAEPDAAAEPSEPHREPGAVGPASSDSAGAAIETHDITPWFERKLAALRAHGTQLTVEVGAGDGASAEIVHVGGQREAVATIEQFRLVDAGSTLVR